MMMAWLHDVTYQTLHPKSYIMLKYIKLKICPRILGKFTFQTLSYFAISFSEVLLKTATESVEREARIWQRRRGHCQCYEGHITQKRLS